MIKLSKEEQKKMEKSVAEAMESPYFKKEFDEAPSEECRDYIRYTYYSGDYYDPDAENVKYFDDLQEKVENALSADDWEYLKRLAPNSPFVGYCDEKIKALSAK